MLKNPLSSEESVGSIPGQGTQDSLRKIRWEAGGGIFTHFLIRLFFFLILSYMSCLHILEIKFLIGCIFYKYVLLYGGLSFCFMVSFAAKALKFNLGPPFVFVFIILGGGSKELVAIYVKDSPAHVFL